MFKTTSFFLGLILLSACTGIPMYAQTAYEHALLNSIGDSIIKGSTDNVRLESSRLLDEKLFSMLSAPESFAKNFDSVKAISTLYSPDKKFRFYQWVLPELATNSYKLFGFLQLYDKKKNKVSLFRLTDSGIEKFEAMEKKLTPQKCYNAVYYQIIPKKYKRKTYYTLLGWRGNNLLTTIKVIDILTLEGNSPSFGAKIFEAGNYQLAYGNIQNKYRIIFEFNAQAVMSLRYEEKKRMIVYDHLSAPKSSLKGLEQFMGPDFSYDAFKWKKGKWRGQTDLDMKNQTSQDKKDFKIYKDFDLK